MPAKATSRCEFFEGEIFEDADEDLAGITVSMSRQPHSRKRVVTSTAPASTVRPSHSMLALTIAYCVPGRAAAGVTDTSLESGVNESGASGFPTASGTEQVAVGRTGYTGGGMNDQVREFPFGDDADDVDVRRWTVDPSARRW